MKKYFYLFLMLLILSSIFFFSSKSSNESNDTSKELINNTICIIEKITNKDLNNIELVNRLNYPVRKTAHFSIFLLLGISLFLFINTFNINHKSIISTVLCVVCAILDETHQLFSIGRTPLILDVFIDSFGAFFGILIINYFLFKYFYLGDNSNYEKI